MKKRYAILAAVLAFLLAISATSRADSSGVASGAAREQGSLLANVYTMSSAEYRACCRTIYTAASHRLKDLLESAEPPLSRPAVVMDLDTTVLDVTSFQTFLYENELDYNSDLWSAYEQQGVEEVLLVPGAREFIEGAEELEVAVVYLSNRNAANQVHTVAVLERLGLNVDGIEDRIYLKPTGASSDKTPRRDAVAARYNVLMIFGDNLRDFSEVFAAEKLGEEASAEDYLRATAARNAAVDGAACHWGVDWFVLPNCMYGEWEKLVPANPENVMTPTRMSVGEE